MPGEYERSDPGPVPPRPDGFLRHRRPSGAAARSIAKGGPCVAKEIEPHLFVLFGATGDLARRKLLPALHHLEREGLLPEKRILLGVGRTLLDDDAYFELLHGPLEEESPEAAVNWHRSQVAYQELTSGDDHYAALRERIESLEREHGLSGNRLFYLALPPAAFTDAVSGLARAGLNKSPGWTRLVVEKPFGRDLESARQLNAQIHRSFDESQIYRIDHFLGKETVQNLLVFRFSNALFESVWDRTHVESVEILVPETLGVEARGPYCEGTGALRDMIQNHLTQILCAVAMETPVALTGDDLRDEKVKVLRAIPPVAPEVVVFGQDRSGQIEDRRVRGYREEPGVDPASHMETFASVRLEVQNWRWQGVPFRLATGKRLRRNMSHVIITFRHPPVCLFCMPGGKPVRTNILDIALSPEEGFDLYFGVKSPGDATDVVPENLSFRYEGIFDKRLWEPYETLLRDALEGEQALFVRSDWVEASWAIYAAALHGDIPIGAYPAGSWGPHDLGRPVEPLPGSARWR